MSNRGTRAFLTLFSLLVACTTHAPSTPGAPTASTTPPNQEQPPQTRVLSPQRPTPAADATPTPPPTQSPAPTTTPSAKPAPTPTSAPPARPRLASHAFMPVGETRSIAGFGELLEVIPLSEPDAVRVEGDTVRGIAGGSACMRFRYRDATGENGVQTQCIVVFDETGDCHDQQPLALDLERFLAPDAPFRGNASLLESGTGQLYAACQTREGRYRLSTAPSSLPPLYIVVVDALGGGAYSLGSDEFERQRAGVVDTFGGAAIRPPWIVPVSLEIIALHLTDDLTLAADAAGCDESPACTPDPAVIQQGDVLSVSVGMPPEMPTAIFQEMSVAQRDRFFQERIGLSWSEVAQVHPDAHTLAFLRLAALELMTGAVDFFDETLGAREKEVIVSYDQPWFAETALPYPGACFPDSIAPGEHERCTRIDAAIQAAEAKAVADLRGSGLRLWYGGALTYGHEGSYAPLENRRPHHALFDGVVAGVGPNSGVSVQSIPEAMAGVVRGFAAEVPHDVPVILALQGPPITAQTGGAFCEAAVCPSDFKGMYEQSEAALLAAMDSLAPGQFAGFGVSLFEGSHFDIREPHEQIGQIALNRVGETGYNNPVLNVYRARSDGGHASTPQPAPTPQPTQASASPTPTSARRCGDSSVKSSIVSGPAGPMGADSDSVFQALAVHPEDPNVVIVGTERNGLAKTADGGRTWTRLRRGLKAVETGYSEVWDVAVSSADPRRVFAATLDSPGPATGNARPITAGIYVSSDAGETWAQSNCGLPSSRVMSVLPHPTDPDVAIIGIEGGFPSYTGDTSFYPGGVFRTEDGGNTWTRFPAGEFDAENGYRVLRTIEEDPWTIMAVGLHFEDSSRNLGFLLSRDGGRSWTPFASELRTREIVDFDASADGETIYANEDRTYGGWVSHDGGLTWTMGPIIQVNGPLAVSPVDDELVMFASQQTLRRSTDGLQSARDIVTAPQPPGHSRPAPFQEIEFARSDPSVVYAVTEGYLFYRSDDAGETFQLMANVRQDVLNAVP